MLEHITSADVEQGSKARVHWQTVQSQAAVYLQVVANGDIADAPASAANLADLLSLDVDADIPISATASTAAVNALQDLLSGDLSADVTAAGQFASSCLPLYVLYWQQHSQVASSFVLSSQGACIADLTAHIRGNCLCFAAACACFRLSQKPAML